MAGLLDQETIDIDCECGTKIPKKIGWLRHNRQFACTRCGTTINVDADEFFRDLQGIDKALGKLDRKITLKL